MLYEVITKAYVESGVSKGIALWNPIDLGYTSTYILYNLVKGKNTGKEGDAIGAGRMGTIKVGAKGLAIMGEPFTFNKDNIAKYAVITSYSIHYTKLYERNWRSAEATASCRACASGTACPGSSSAPGRPLPGGFRSC